MTRHGSVDLEVKCEFRYDEAGIVGLSILGVEIPVSNIPCRMLSDLEDEAMDDFLATIRSQEETRNDEYRHNHDT